MPQRYYLLGSEEPSGLCGRSLDFNQQRRSSNDFALLVLGRFATVTGQRSRILSMAIFYRCPSQRARMPLRFPMLPMLLRHSTSLWPAFVPSQNAHSGVGSRSYIWDFKLKAEPYFIDTYTTPGQAIQDYVHALQLYLIFCMFISSFSTC